jgi:hypothetical protein
MSFVFTLIPDNRYFVDEDGNEFEIETRDGYGEELFSYCNGEIFFEGRPTGLLTSKLYHEDVFDLRSGPDELGNTIFYFSNEFANETEEMFYDQFPLVPNPTLKKEIEDFNSANFTLKPVHETVFQKKHTVGYPTPHISTSTEIAGYLIIFDNAIYNTEVVDGISCYSFSTSQKAKPSKRYYERELKKSADYVFSLQYMVQRWKDKHNIK